MIFAALLVAAIAAAPASAPREDVPAVLTEARPSLSLRWRAVALETPEGHGVTQVVPGGSAVAAVELSTVLRVQGRFTAGCAPVFSRRFVSAGGSVDVPLSAPPLRELPKGDGRSEAVLVIPPALGADPTAETPIPALIGLTLARGCAPVDVQAFEADEDPDPDAEFRTETELDDLAVRANGSPNANERGENDATLVRWLEAPHAHAWQQQAALALALPRLLAQHSESSPSDEAQKLGRVLLTGALAEIRTHNASFVLSHELLQTPPAVSVPGEIGRWVRLEPGHDLEAEVDAAEVIALQDRGEVQGDARSPIAWRLAVSFDGRPARVLLAHGAVDPDGPTQARTRNQTVVVPFGARRLRLRAIERAVFVRASGVRPKQAIADLWRRPPSALNLLAEVARSRRSGPGAAVAGRLARAFLAVGPATDDSPRGAGVPAAWLALIEAQRTADPASVSRLLASAAADLERAHSPLERAAARLIQAMMVRLRAERAVAAGDARTATSIWLEQAAQHPLVDEDAEALLEADAFACDRLEGSPLALEVVDGLLARRPLDRTLALSRSRANAGAARWQELVADTGMPETPFLDLIPDHGGVPSAETSSFAELVGGHTSTIELTPPPLPGHLPVLSLIAQRASAASPIVDLRVDGHPLRLAAVGPFERTEIPLAPGRHRLELAEPATSTRVLTNFSLDEGPRWRRRRFVELGNAPIELRNREVGAADVVLVAVRTVMAPGAKPPGPFDLLLGGHGATPVAMRVQPGAALSAPFGDIDPDRTGTDAVEALLPIGRGHATFRLSLRGRPEGVRVFVHLAARRRQPVLVPDPPPMAALDQMRAILTGREVGVPHLAALTQRLATEKPRGPVLLARALTLAALEEPMLAREDLASALADPALADPEHRLALALWRHLDAISSLNYPATVDARASAAQAPGLGLTDLEFGASAALTKVLDSRTRLRALKTPGTSPSDDQQMSPLAVVAAARQAERDRDMARAGDLWEALAKVRHSSALYTRAGGALLTMPPDPIRDLRTYVALHTATDLDPYDAAAARLLRRASGRTRLTPVHEVDDSAGISDVELAPSDGNDDTVEAALLGAESTKVGGDLVTSERQLNLALDLAAPTVVRVVAHVRELRPRAARALGLPGVELAWVKDGLDEQRLSCARVGICRSGPIPLPSGSHSLLVRLVGGVRPAARVEVLSNNGRASSAAHAVEYLRAREDRPVVATLFGPAVIEAELRPAAPSPFGGTPARAVSISVRPTSGPAQPSREVVLPAYPQGDSRSDCGRRLTSLRPEESGAAAPRRETTVTTTLVLPHDQAYRIVLRPPRGEALCRLLVRDGAGTDTQAPPPRVSSLSRIDTPAPLFAPASLEQGLAARAIDGDVSPGLDAFGALAFEVGWRAVADLGEEDEQVYPKSAGYTSLTYRRLIENLHITLKMTGEARRWTTGDTSGDGEMHAYFLHPDARWARGLISLVASGQNLSVGRAWSSSATMMFEPIATIASAVHIVSKLGLRLRRLSESELSTDDLRRVDPDVFNTHAASHPRALFWEEGLELEPLSNLLIYSGARVTTNPDLSLRHPDHISAEVVARSIFGRLQIEGGVRSGWFFADDARDNALLRRQVSLSSLYTFWWDHRNALAVSLTVAHHFDLGIDQASLGLAWEFSNGRRLQDHTAVEEENYFFPQRGPERETGGLQVDGAAKAVTP